MNYALQLMCLCAVSGLATVWAADASAAALSYDNLGRDWPGLCQGGKEQSPINVVQDDLVPIDDPAKMARIESLGIVTGAKMFVTATLPHVEVVWDKFVSPAKATIPATLDGDVFAPIKNDIDPSQLRRVAFEPIQFHFHTPSEAALDGELFDGVLHIVNLVKDGESEKCDAVKAAGGLGCPVVVSVFLSGTGLSSPFDPLLTNAPKVTGDPKGTSVWTKPALRAVGKENALYIGPPVDITSFLPSNGDYATWPGSLTTAPCTEGIVWLKLLTPVRVSPEQITHLEDTIALAVGDDCKEIRDGQCYPPRVAVNNRHIQELHGRVLKTGFLY